MRKAWLIISLALSSTIFAAPQDTAKAQPVKKLLFLPFYNESADKNYTWLETSIGHSIHESAKTKFTYDKIDDGDFTMYFINKGYALNALYDFDKITQIAHDLGVDGVIYGTFKPSDDKASVIVTGKILSVIDREVISEKTVTMPASAEMFSSVDEVSQHLGQNISNLFYPSDRGAAIRAATLPGWGHRYKQRPVWGYVWGGTFWTAVGFTAFSTFQFIRYKVQYANYSPEVYTAPNGSTAYRDPAGAQAQFDAYGDNINRWGQFSLIGIITVAIVYGANILHAYFISPDVITNPDLTGEQKQAQFKFNYFSVRNESFVTVSYDWRY